MVRHSSSPLGLAMLALATAACSGGAAPTVDSGAPIDNGSAIDGDTDAVTATDAADDEAPSPRDADTDTATSRDAPCATDDDGDGVVAASCGGGDCDDNDARRFPGNAEVCDEAGHDEDCNPCTVASATTGDGDGDEDTYVSLGCFNAFRGSTPRCDPSLVRVDGAMLRVVGRDCDDANNNVRPDQAEVCNGFDDNCNGMTDEGTGGGSCGTMSPGACQPGTNQCVRGAITCVSTVLPGTQPETCNGLDDDCDGMTDEENPGGGAACTSSLPGACAAGAQTCVGGALRCVETVRRGERTETCNGLDDDCDGAADNGAAAGCPATANAAPTCAGACGFACNTNFADCNAIAADGCEVNTQTSAAHCGACGRVCTSANGTGGCAGGACTVGSCNPNFGNCDGNAANGCETDTRSSPAHCGGCGRPCSIPNASAGCAGGACTIAACNANFGNCDGSAANGCETSLLSTTAHCGACGARCTAPSGGSVTCSSGTCVPSCPAGTMYCAATRTCGISGACNPYPASTYLGGRCSAPGSYVCSTSGGAYCSYTPPARAATFTLAATDANLRHNCGRSNTNWEVADPGCDAQFGPYFALPAGRYRATVRYAYRNYTGGIALLTQTAGFLRVMAGASTLGSTQFGPFPPRAPLAPYYQTGEFTVSTVFTVGAECLNGVEFKVNTGDLSTGGAIFLQIIETAVEPY